MEYLRLVSRLNRKLPLSYSFSARHICSKYNSYLLYKRNYYSTNNNGLFGLSRLINPEDFIIHADNAINNINSMRAIVRSYVESYSSDTDENKSSNKIEVNEAMLVLDAISNELCGVIDAAELCRNVHTNHDYIEAAQVAFAKLSSTIHELNSDLFLYKAVITIIERYGKSDVLSVEDKLFLSDLRAEFENEGIHIALLAEETEKAVTDSEDCRQAIDKALNAKTQMLLLQQQVVNNETMFSQNVTSGKNTELILGPFIDMDHLRVLKNWTKQFVPQRKFSQGEFYLTCNTDRSISMALLDSIKEREIRQQLWVGCFHQPHDNISVLGSLVQSRQALAKHLGYPSHAHKVLTKMAVGCPEAVEELLTDLSAASRSKTVSELSVLKDIAVKEHNAEIVQMQIMPKFIRKLYEDSPAYDSSGGEKDDQLYPWDIGYVKKIHGGTDGYEAASRAAIAACSYFPLNRCIDGLRLISYELFGLILEHEEISINESWVSGASGMGSAEPVLKYGVYDTSRNSKKRIGTVYLDLYSRPGKFTGAAHFTVQCGCERLRFNHENSHGENARYETFKQLPVVALVFNFKKPSSSEMPLLSLPEVETLHHEWGHALHSLLSSTKYQHLSGTRGSTDFIEVPSHLFEYFARDVSVIQRWARHHISGETIPKNLLEAALSHRNLFSGIDLQGQILYSAVDQYLFGTNIGDLSGKVPESVYYHAVEGSIAVQQQFTVLPISLPSAGAAARYSKEGIDLRLPHLPLLTNTHLINYGATYYSYLFAKMYAAQIWHKNFSTDPLNRSAGEYVRDVMLSHGASHPVKQMLSKAAGNVPLDPDYFLRSVL